MLLVKIKGCHISQFAKNTKFSHLVAVDVVAAVDVAAVVVSLIAAVVVVVGVVTVVVVVLVVAVAAGKFTIRLGKCTSTATHLAYIAGPIYTTDTDKDADMYMYRDTYTDARLQFGYGYTATQLHALYVDTIYDFNRDQRRT